MVCEIGPLLVSGLERLLNKLREKKQLLEITIQMGAFGGMSWKATTLQGSWRGLKLVDKVYHMLLPKMRHREFIQLTKQSGEYFVSIVCFCFLTRVFDSSTSSVWTKDWTHCMKLINFPLNPCLERGNSICFPFAFVSTRIPRLCFFLGCLCFQTSGGKQLTNTQPILRYILLLLGERSRSAFRPAKFTAGLMKATLGPLRVWNWSFLLMTLWRECPLKKR